MIGGHVTRKNLQGLVFGLGGVGTFTWVYVGWLHITDATTAALSYLIVLLFVAASFPLWVAIGTTVAASLTLDFLFFPPVGTFNISDPEDWVAFSSFIVASLVASELSSRARRRQAEAMTRRDELGRLFDLSQDVLLITDGADALHSLAELIRARFVFGYVSIALRKDGVLERYDARSPHKAGPPETVVLPIHDISRMTASLEVSGRSIEPATLNALAGLVAIAIERIHFLDERRHAELAQRSIELKSMLMASLAHDLHTPLTAIRLAVDNLTTPHLTDLQRASQAEVARTAVDRLSRLFRNILEMTRIDAGTVAAQLQWVSPTDLIDAARSQVAYVLTGHAIDVIDHAGGQAVCVDARLTSAALAHVMENAAQYSPPGSRIVITTELTAEGLRLSVRDYGTGIAASDASRMFERFYRGSEATRHVSGTGMGLAIAQGLLAAEGGRISAANCPDGGAEFSIVVPTERRALTDEDDS